MKTKKLIDLTIEEKEVSTLPVSYPGTIKSNQRDRIFKEIKGRLEKALWVTPERKFFLAPLDPGSGKTTLLSDFIKDRKRGGYHLTKGILLCFATKAEIEAFIIASGMEDADFAIQTSDTKLNSRGLGYHAANDAWVLLTTHQMVRHHAGASFEKVEQFHYKGKPRHLRVWDEGLSLSETVSIRLDDIASLYGPLRPDHRLLVEGLEASILPAAYATAGDRVTVPSGLKFPSLLEAADVFGGEKDLRVGHLGKLALLQGVELEVQDDKRYGKMLIGHTRELPADFAPVFILDGSGRLKHIYKLYEKHRRNWHRLPAFKHDYADLKIHWWNCAAGKTNMKDGGKRKTIVDAAADKINADDEDWLVICHKGETGGSFDIQQEIRDSIKANPRRVQFIHWGIHRASNDYRHIKRVMIIGALNYPESEYGAIYKASSGMPAAHAMEDDLRALRRSEVQNHILQAVTRSNVRNADKDGKCGEAEVYIVGPAVTVNDDMLKETFPGCSVIPWEPVAKPLSKQEARFVEEVIKRLSGGVLSVTKKEVREALGVHASQISRFLREARVQHNLIGHGIHFKGTKFEKTASP